MLDVVAQGRCGLLALARCAQRQDLRVLPDGAGRVIGGADLKARRALAILQQSGDDAQRARAIGVAQQVEVETTVQVAPPRTWPDSSAAP
jgi:hypothetical protein